MMSPILSSLSNSSSGPKPSVSSRTSLTSRCRSLRFNKGFSESQSCSTTPLISLRRVLGSISAMRFMSSRSTRRVWMWSLSDSYFACSGSTSLGASPRRRTGFPAGTTGVMAGACITGAGSAGFPGGGGSSATEALGPNVCGALGANGPRASPFNISVDSSYQWVSLTARRPGQDPVKVKRRTSLVWASTAHKPPPDVLSVRCQGRLGEPDFPWRLQRAGPLCSWRPGTAVTRWGPATRPASSRSLRLSSH